MITPSIISNQYDGKKRTLFEKQCEKCKKLFYIPKHIFQTTRFCSKTCCSESLRTKIKFECPQCYSVFEAFPKRLKASKGKILFCSRKCKDVAQSFGGIFQQAHVKNGSHDYRNRAFKTFGKSCKQCGYSKNESMLDVDHINGNRSHNKQENLQVLCVWCHALKTRKISFHVNGAVAHLGEQLICNQQAVGS